MIIMLAPQAWVYCCELLNSTPLKLNKSNGFGLHTIDALRWNIRHNQRLHLIGRYFRMSHLCTHVHSLRCLPESCGRHISSSVQCLMWNRWFCLRQFLTFLPFALQPNHFPKPIAYWMYLVLILISENWYSICLEYVLVCFMAVTK